MHILLAAAHRYSAEVHAGSGLSTRRDPSGAIAMVHDMIAKGLGELGHTVHYLLEKGHAGALPPGVVPVSGRLPDVDIYHNRPSHTVPWVTTQHGFYDASRRKPDGHTIFVSRTLARAYNLERAVWNGVDPSQYVYSEQKSDYFVFLSAMQGPKDKSKYESKGLGIALGLCQKTGLRLIVAGTATDPGVVERVGRICREAGAEYVGDVRGPAKAELLAGAKGLLFPTQVVEGFGLVMAEALISGTPVICSNYGACPEIISSDVGFVCASESEYLFAVEQIDRISPRRCRELAMERYHYRSMCANYVREYEREIAGHP